MSPSTEPFNKEKYEALMDGYECSEIMLSSVLNGNTSFRIDAEFFSKDSISIIKKLDNIGTKKYLDVTQKIDVGFVGSMKDEYTDENTGVPLLQTQNINEFLINCSNIKYINSSFHEKLKKSQVKYEDILIARSGSFGKASIFLDKDVCNSSDIIISHAKKGVNPYSLVAFLNSKYGVQQLIRFASGGVQGHVNLTILETLRIWEPKSDQLNRLIKKLILFSNELVCKSNKTYKQCENILLSELGVDITLLKSGGVSVKSFSDSLGDSGRLDAEYYQPKYDSLIESISVLKHKELAELVKITKSIEPGRDAYFDEGIPFIRISDISKYEITEPDKYLEECGEYDSSELYLKKDEILFSKDGSVGIAYKVEEDSRMISSSALLHLEVKDKNKVLPDYLTTVLNSDVVQLQAERDAGGSIIKHWKPKEIEKVVIPILDIDIQKEIAKKASESFKLRKQSRQLLDCTKNAVEMAIEKGEKTAIEWLNEKNKELMK